MLIGKREIDYGIEMYREEGLASLLQSAIKFGFDQSPFSELSDPRDSKQIERDHKRFVNEFFDSREEYESYINEWLTDPLQSYLSSAIRIWESEGHHGADNLYYLPLYAYIRKNNPTIIVETGVKDGWSTLFTLSALLMNFEQQSKKLDNNIKLYSIDLSDEEWSYRENKHPGWILPDELNQSAIWELRRGPYRHELFDLLSHLDGIDVFNHDSEHSICNMLFEYELAAMHLNTDGLIVSDNIYGNSAFDHFTNCHRYNSTKLAGGSDLDEYWWKLNTDTKYPNAKKRPKDNLGAIWK